MDKKQIDDWVKQVLRGKGDLTDFLVAPHERYVVETLAEGDLAPELKDKIRAVSRKH